MSKFGWSLPAGCHGTPYDESAGPCDVCGQDVDSDQCRCPECPECGAVGRLECYGETDGHGLVRSQAQIDGRARLEASLAVQREAEIRWIDDEIADTQAIKQSTPSVQTMGQRWTALGMAVYLRVYTTDYRPLLWREIHDAFQAIYPGAWAVQVFPPDDCLVDEENIYHLFMFSGPFQFTGLNIK